MIKGERGPLYYNKDGGYPGGSGATQPNSRMVPATQADLEYQEPLLVKGDILQHYELGERIAFGGQGKVHKGREMATGTDDVIKRYNGEDAETIKEWQTILNAKADYAREIGM